MLNLDSYSSLAFPGTITKFLLLMLTFKKSSGVINLRIFNDSFRYSNEFSDRMITD